MTTLLLSDSFNGTFANLENHLADTANSWVKHPLFSGTAIIDGVGFARATATNQDCRYYSSMVPNSAEYTVTGTVKIFGTTAQSVMVTARMDTAANTMYYANVNAQAGVISLGKFVTGTLTELGTTTFTPVRNQTFTFALECKNAAKKVFVNAVEAISSADDTITGTGRAGVRFHATSTVTDSAKLDSISVSDDSVDTTPPPAPGGLGVTAKIASADLTWTPVADIGGAMRQYHIEAKKTSDGAGSWLEVNTAGAVASSKRVYNLTPGLSWDLRMRAEDQSLNFGSYSSTIAVTPTTAGSASVPFNELTGTPSNVTFDVLGLLTSGFPDAAASFDGSSSVATFAHDAAFNLPALDVTVSAIIRPTTVPGPGVIRSIVARAGQLQLRTNGSALECVMVTDQGLFIANGPAAMVSGFTYDCVAVLTGGQLTLYVNGTLLGTPLAVPGTVVAVTQSLEIGATASDQYFHGAIKDVAILTEALSPTRIGLDNVDVAVNAAPPTGAKLETLEDDFNDNALNAAKWTVTSAGVVETGQQLVIPTTGSYPTVVTTEEYDFTNSSMMIQVVAQPTGHDADQLGPLVRSTLDAQAQVQFIYAATPLLLRAQYMNTAGTWVDVATATHSATNHAWRRMREANGTIFWETSPNSVDWTAFASVAWSASGWPRGHLEHTKAYIFAGNFQNVGGRPDFVVDNFNLEGIPVLLAGTAAGVGQVTGSIVAPGVTFLTGNAAGTGSASGFPFAGTVVTPDTDFPTAAYIVPHVSNALIVQLDRSAIVL